MCSAIKYVFNNNLIDIHIDLSPNVCLQFIKLAHKSWRRPVYTTTTLPHISQYICLGLIETTQRKKKYRKAQFVSCSRTNTNHLSPNLGCRLCDTARQHRRSRTNQMLMAGSDISDIWGRNQPLFDRPCVHMVKWKFGQVDRF